MRNKSYQVYGISLFLNLNGLTHVRIYLFVYMNRYSQRQLVN